jgi:hypothetical protein
VTRSVIPARRAAANPESMFAALLELRGIAFNAFSWVWIPDLPFRGNPE